MSNRAATLNTVQSFLQTNLSSACDLTIPLPGTFLRKLKMCFYSMTWMWMVTAETPKWEPSRCLSINQWTNKICFIDTMDYLSALRNKPLINTTTWLHFSITIAKWKKPDTKGYMLYDFINMKCPVSFNDGDRMQISAVGTGADTSGFRDLLGWSKYSQTGFWWWLYKMVNIYKKKKEGREEGRKTLSHMLKIGKFMV